MDSTVQSLQSPYSSNPNFPDSEDKFHRSQRNVLSEHFHLTLFLFSGTIQTAISSTLTSITPLQEEEED